MITILIVILILLMIGVLPTWPYASGLNYGYYPSGIIAVVLIIVLILLLTGHLPP